MLDEQDIVETMQWIVDTILIPHFMELGLDATGEWRSSLTVRAEKDKGIIRGREYTEQLVYGRRPNENQNPDAIRRWAYGMANYNPEFKKWLQARGLTQYGTQIAYKIGAEGTNIYKDGGTDLLEILETPENIRKIQKHLQDILTPKVQLFLEREIKEAWQQ